MAESFLEFVKGLGNRDNVRTLDLPALERSARPFGRATTDESLAYFSNVRNRSAAVAVVLGSERVRSKNLTERQKAILERSEQTLAEVKEYLKNAPLIRVQRTICDNSDFLPRCNLFLSVQRPDNIRQAYLWATTLRDYVPDVHGPEIYEVCVPEWPENDKQVLVFPEENLTVILGSDYVGEVKMGFLRMAMWDAKQEGMLSLHAGSKLVSAKQKDGSVKRYGMLLFGLSGTGKSTHSCHDHGLDGVGEGINILQDDIVFLRKDGSALGTERGFYMKTEGVNPTTQPAIYGALTSPSALLENVMVSHDGKVDFTDLSLGGNGRTVIPREALGHFAGKNINLPPLSELDGLIIAFITRRMTVLPLVSKLTPDQAAAAFMLGESVETTAGDPRRAGESVRVVGTNPFIVGDEALEGNWIYDFVTQNSDKVHCYLINTGGVGEILERDAQGKAVEKQKVLRVNIDEMAALIRGIIRDTIEWEREPNFSAQSPQQIADGVDLSKFSLSNFYTPQQIQEYVDRLKVERHEWLSSFPGLKQEVVNAYSQS